MTQQTTLYTFRRCPYAMRVRMALRYAGVEYEHREVLLKAKPQTLLRASPKGTVPVLVLPDGTVLDESLDIMHWALEQSDPAGWRALAAPTLAQADTLVGSLEQDFKRHLDGYKYGNHQASEMWLPHRMACAKFMLKLEQQLAAQRYLFSDEVGFADVAVVPFVRQFANVDKSWFAQEPWPHTQAWLAHLLDSKLFTSIMRKVPLWDETAQERSH